jgi:hypothetical protein
MSDGAIAILRWVLLFVAVTTVLQATVLHGWIRRRISEGRATLTERARERTPATWPSDTMLRVWPAVMGLVAIGLWWYFGTSAGAEVLRTINP